MTYINYKPTNKRNDDKYQKIKHLDTSPVWSMSGISGLQTDASRLVQVKYFHQDILQLELKKRKNLAGQSGIGAVVVGF